MRLPSLQHVFSRLIATFRRFYIPMLFAVIGTIAAIILIEKHNEPPAILVKLLFTCILGLPFSVGCMLFAERSSGTVRIASIASAIALPALYGVFLAQGDFFEDDKATLLFFVLLIVSHLFVSVAAYLRVQEQEGFWRFNELLFLRMVVSGIFSGVLFAGLALAIASIDNLFQVRIDEDIYPKLWCAVAGIFNTCFFLSGIPGNYREIDAQREYPKGLKFFAQYILLPLASLYLLILYAYGSKILIEWSLPRGWVSMLIMVYAVIGILALLLIHPLRHENGQAWIRLFTRIFFIALLPLIALLYIAIFTRTGQYGITEPRYYLIALGLWLTFIALYFIFSKQKNIKLIPVSLIIAGLLTIFGPWSSFSVSSRSQVAELEAVLSKYGIKSVNGTMSKPADTITSADAMQIRSIVQYFIEKRELEALNEVYGRDVAMIGAGIEQKNRQAAPKNKDIYYRYETAEQTRDTLLAMLHMDNGMYSTDMAKAVNDGFTYHAQEHSTLNIAGYDKLVEYRYNDYEDADGEGRMIVLSGKDSLEFTMQNEICPVLLIKTKGLEVARFELKPVIDSFKKNQHAEFNLNATGKMDAAMKITWFSLTRDNRSAKPIEHWQAYIMWRR
ncbi:MAG: DUF4153 domain-containing protein [Sphingobacteriales bacterium]|nr:MAG: DUF4153 domain-containing protein [Sphingobacteriales bacterium]